MMRRLLGLAWPHRWGLLLATVFLAIGSGLGLTYPALVGKLLDQAIRSGDIAAIDKLALLMGAVFIGQAAAIGLRYALFTVIGERIVADLREALFARLMRQPVAFFDTRRTGELLNRLSSDTAVLQNTVTANLSMALRSLVTALGAIGLLFIISPSLTLLMLMVVPPAALGAVTYGRKIRRLSREVQDTLATASEVAEETLSGIRTVRSFDREADETRRYSTAIEDSFLVAKRRAILGGFFTSLASLFGYLAIAIVLWRGGRLVLGEALSVGELTSFILYTILMAFSIGTLASLWTDFMRAAGAGERVFALLDRAVEHEADPSLFSPEDGWMGDGPNALEVSGVTFSYPARPDVEVLQDVSVRLPRGKVVALVGPSGSGKSTLVALLTRLYDVDSGVISVEGRPIHEWDIHALRRRMAVVGQEPVLFSTTIKDNIRYGRDGASDEEVLEAAKMANAHDFIEGFPDGYDTMVGERGVQLSGGQRQRIAIARAMLRDPALLLLDEATSALDSESELMVQDALERLMVGRTTLVIAHRLSTIRNADVIIVMDKAKVVESGDHKSLIERDGLYARLVRAGTISDVVAQ